MNTPIRPRHAHSAPQQQEAPTTPPTPTRRKIGNIVSWRMESVVSPDLQTKAEPSNGGA